MKQLKMKKRIKICSIFLLMLLLTGCGKGQAEVEESNSKSGNQGASRENVIDEEAAAEDIMAETKPSSVLEKEADAVFCDTIADFSVELFKRSYSQGENSLISPLSVMVALAMTANGADGETLTQMERVLGNGMALEELNVYLHSYITGLPSQEETSLKVANSIWFRDEENRIRMNQDFLQTNADYYQASVYPSAFGEQTLLDINNWVTQKTDGMINEIINSIGDDAMLYLINAVAFDAEWEQQYDERDVYDGYFNRAAGDAQKVDFMSSEEQIYLQGDNVTGFLKNYKGGQYSFLGLLPQEGITLDEYIGSLTGEDLLTLIDQAEITTVNVQMPKFESSCEILMNDPLSEMGMPDAFRSDADFGKMSDARLYISQVLHKTYILVDEHGTKAAAVTDVAIAEMSMTVETKSVTLDRPFLYAIIDNNTNLPIFIGTVTEIE